jgi:surface antigen
MVDRKRWPSRMGWPKVCLDRAKEARDDTAPSAVVPPECLALGWENFVMKTRLVLLPLLGLFAIPSFVQGQHTERGAALGGVGGALAGAAIGRNNGDTAIGALVGGAVGLFTGAAIGNSVDERERRAAYQNQQQYLYSRAASANDIISMSQSGVAEEVIINHIRENGIQRRPEVSDVIALHRQGVSERVITAMQTASEGGRPIAPPQPVYRARPVVVEEYYYVRPAYCPPPHFHHYHHHHHPHSHVHWGFSFGH